MIKSKYNLELHSSEKAIPTCDCAQILIHYLKYIGKYEEAFPDGFKVKCTNTWGIKAKLKLRGFFETRIFGDEQCIFCGKYVFFVRPSTTSANEVVYKYVELSKT